MLQLNRQDSFSKRLINKIRSTSDPPFLYLKRYHEISIIVMMEVKRWPFVYTFWVWRHLVLSSISKIDAFISIIEDDNLLFVKHSKYYKHKVHNGGSNMVTSTASSKCFPIQIEICMFDISPVGRGGST